MTISLPPLPYSMDALEPHISADTLSFHHGKHHNAYVVNLNNLLKDRNDAPDSLEEIIYWSAQDPSRQGIFNNAAQVWNHTFYWNCMKPQGGGAPTGPIADLIIRDFGNWETFKEQFATHTISQFGSGWGWLVVENERLSLMKTGNADLPMIHGKKALLTCDVWEHAYYLDYQNRRPDYIKTFLDYLVNWDFANQQLISAA